VATVSSNPPLWARPPLWAGQRVLNTCDEIYRGLADLGDFAIFSWRMASWLFSRLVRKGTLVPVFYQIGVRSVPVVAITGLFIGMVLAVQTHDQFRQMHLETRLGSVINISLVRELGPVLAATMLAGRVGSAMAAELGTMRVTEQIDALWALGANPIHYLVVPRFLACFLLIPLLTVLADYMGVLGGQIIAIEILGVDRHHYWYHARNYVGLFDLWAGVFKSVFFGAAIALIGCHRGFNCGGGAEGVGRAATQAFVYSFIAILVLDFFLGVFLNGVYLQLWPHGGGGLVMVGTTHTTAWG
jgi:phospholipid/cholesterol/gamma-HCH transport system permease protein